MATMNPSKGGLAQSFMQNTATQPAPLPEITQPQNQFTVPELAPQPAPQPVMGSMAPSGPKPGTRDYFEDYLKRFLSGDKNLGLFRSPHPSDPSLMRVYEPGGYGSRASDGTYHLIPNPDYAPQGQVPQQQTAPQMSEAQRLARAINERAMNR